MEAVYFAGNQYGSKALISLDGAQLCVCSFSDGAGTPAASYEAEIVEA